MRAWFNPNLESRWFFVPGIVGLLTLLVTMLVTALSVAREREQGTFDQLLVTPLRPGEILLGKALPSFVIGIAEATLIILVAVFWFNVPLLGSLLTLYTGVVLFLLSAIGLGLMISSLAVTQQQGLLGAFFFLVPAIILSGFATPIANMPRLGAGPDPDQPHALFSGGVARRVSRGHALSAADPAVCRDGVDRRGCAGDCGMAVPAQNVLRCLERISKRLGQTKPQRAHRVHRENQNTYLKQPNTKYVSLSVFPLCSL